MCPSDREKWEEKSSFATEHSPETASEGNQSDDPSTDKLNSILGVDPAEESSMLEDEGTTECFVTTESKDKHDWVGNDATKKGVNGNADTPIAEQDHLSRKVLSPDLESVHKESIVKTISEIDSSSEGCLAEENNSVGTSISQSNKNCDSGRIRTSPIQVFKSEDHDSIEPRDEDGNTFKIRKVHSDSFSGNDLDEIDERRYTDKNESLRPPQHNQHQQYQRQTAHQQYNEASPMTPQMQHSQAARPFANVDAHAAPHPMVMLPTQHMGGIVLPPMQPSMHYMQHHPHPHPVSSPVQLSTMYTNGSSFLMERNSFVDHSGFVSQQHQQVIAPPLPPQHGLQHQQQQNRKNQQPFRKRMVLRLVEKQEAAIHNGGKKSIFSILKKRSKSRSVGSSDDITDYSPETMNSTENYNSPQSVKKFVTHGEVTISWYEGTSAIELQEHVRKSVERKVHLGTRQTMVNLRILDESVEPYEEIVLSPYIPDGSRFLLTFRIKDLSTNDKYSSHHHRAPPSPSAAPSPPGELEQELQRQISEVLENTRQDQRRSTKQPGSVPASETLSKSSNLTPKRSHCSSGSVTKDSDDIDVTAEETKRSKSGVSESLSMNDMSKIVPLLHENGVEDNILAARLEELNASLLRLHNDGPWSKDDPTYKKTEKKQVVFVLANYFVLFLSLIAISAEIHERAPAWIEYINENVTSVQNCAVDRDALFECISEGNFSGLIASIILWASQSVATKRLFLFGFDSPGKLWTVVYEAGVTALCWGTSYLAIRRGLNPDTRPNCLRKYWKDAVYGSLAGFNAAFMKAVLKNLLPKADEVFDVMEGRQLHLVKQLGKLFKAGTEL